MFEKIFGQILDNHAPVKIFQTRYNYAPWLSDKTKNDIKIRNELKYQSTISNDPEILHKYKCLRNSIKARLKNEEETYYKDKFRESKSNVKNLWKCAYEILGQFNDFSPSQLNYNGTVIKSPDKLAEIFNEIFLSKVSKLKNSIPSEHSLHSINRLSDWLRSHNVPLNIFSYNLLTKNFLIRQSKN